MINSVTDLRDNFLCVCVCVCSASFDFFSSELQIWWERFLQGCKGLELLEMILNQIEQKNLWSVVE